MLLFYPASQINHLWLFSHLYVRYCFIPVDSTHRYQIWMVRSCQGFGAQCDVASCRKRESRGKAKQDIFRSVRGADPLLLSALKGKRTKGSALSLLSSPLFCPHPALLSPGNVLRPNTSLLLSIWVKQGWMTPSVILNYDIITIVGHGNRSEKQDSVFHTMINSIFLTCRYNM